VVLEGTESGVDNQNGQESSGYEGRRRNVRWNSIGRSDGAGPSSKARAERKGVGRDEISEKRKTRGKGKKRGGIRDGLSDALKI